MGRTLGHLLDRSPAWILYGIACARVFSIHTYALNLGNLQLENAIESLLYNNHMRESGFPGQEQKALDYQWFTAVAHVLLFSLLYRLNIMITIYNVFLIKFSQQQNRLAMYYTIPGTPLPCFPISTPLGHCLWQLSCQICQVDQEDSPHTVPSPSGPTCRGWKEGEEVWRGRSRDQEHSYYLPNYSTEVHAGVFIGHTFLFSSFSKKTAA